ncbi:hypothetical protein R6G99_09465, partial [Actinotignum timonense]|nr:hypothetical protein [Actinotignum timonense]
AHNVDRMLQWHVETLLELAETSGGLMAGPMLECSRALRPAPAPVPRDVSDWDAGRGALANCSATLAPSLAA